MGNEAIMILRLDGVMQSYGDASQWDYRGTCLMPTKSAVVGMLGCALGYERDDPHLFELSKEIDVAVRADRRGKVMEDYHTVKNVLNTDLKPRGTAVTHRKYLFDACFTVAVKGANEWLQRCKDALQNPKWCVYLGRKACVPSRPIFECLTTEYETLEKAICSYPLCNKAEEGDVYYEHTVEYLFEGTSELRQDDIVGKRVYQARRVAQGKVGGQNVSDEM